MKSVHCNHATKMGVRLPKVSINYNPNDIFPQPCIRIHRRQNKLRLGILLAIFFKLKETSMIFIQIQDVHLCLKKLVTKTTKPFTNVTTKP